MAVDVGAGARPGTGVPYQAEIRWILQAAMVLFIYTVAIGILNGLDLVDFERKALLAHLHVGTLGWITMAVFAGALTLLGAGSAPSPLMRRMALAAPVVAAAYNIAFLTTTNVARPVLGSLMLVVIAVFAVWGFSRARGRVLSVPHVGMLAGLAFSVIGAVLGVLLGLRISTPDLEIAESVGSAHPGAMVVGFLFPVGMAFAEWVMDPRRTEQRATVAGWLQIGLPFLGGVLAVVGLLFEIEPLLMPGVLFMIVGLIIFLVRIAPLARQISWLGTSPARHGIAAAPFLVVHVAVLFYLISNYIEDFEAAPRRLVLALDHSIFVGVMTLTILGLIARMSTTRRAAWVDHAVFYGVVVGVAGFLTGLLSDTDAIIRVFTPLLGVAILFAIAVHVRGLGDPREAFR